MFIDNTASNENKFSKSMGNADTVTTYVINIGKEINRLIMGRSQAQQTQKQHKDNEISDQETSMQENNNSGMTKQLVIFQEYNLESANENNVEEQATNLQINIESMKTDSKANKNSEICPT